MSDAKIGRRRGDRRVRIALPGSRYFRTAGRDEVVARAAAIAPRPGLDRQITRLRRFAFGRPLANDEEAGERLGRAKALNANGRRIREELLGLPHVLVAEVPYRRAR